MEIKGQSLEQWRKWLISELTPPLANFAKSVEGRYALEGFLELIDKTSGTDTPKPKYEDKVEQVGKYKVHTVNISDMQDSEEDDNPFYDDPF